MNINFVVMRLDNVQIVGAFEYEHNAQYFKDAYEMPTKIYSVHEITIDPVIK